MPTSQIRNFDYESWKQRTECRVVGEYLDQNFWIEDDTNAPRNQGNCFLMIGRRSGDGVVCVGGVEKHANCWEASISIMHDKDTGNDCRAIYYDDLTSEGRATAIKKLWEKRYDAYIYT